MTDEPPSVEDRLRTLSRRQFLAGAGATLTAVGAVRAVHNTILGYGHFGMGTNLKEQELSPVVSENLRLRYDEEIDGTRIQLVDDNVWVAGGDRYLDLDADSRSVAAEVDSEYDLGGRLTALFSDAASIRDDSVRFEFSQPAEFFERIDATDGRPDVVTALRGRWDRAVDPSVVEIFTGAESVDTEALVWGLMEGFREHGRYDVPRYIAGSVEDNVIFGVRDLRDAFQDDVDFESLLEADTTGLFCWELVYRSNEALQAVPASAQTAPVATCYVRDSRHKHAYTGIISAVREGGELVLPMTFVDYTYSTLYDDLRITGLRGEGLAAYDTSHRADEVLW